MFVAFVKQLIQNGGGKFNIVRLEAETESELNTKRDTYLSADYQDSTEEEYNAENDERDERQGTDGGAEIVGEPETEAPSEEEAPSESQSEEPVAESVPVEIATSEEDNSGVDAEA